MILGLSTATFTLLHVILSLVGIISGVIVVVGMLRSKRLTGWAALFLATTVLTSVTGFLFPFERLLPSHIVGIISLVVLAAAIVGLYGYRLAGAWRWIYVVGAVLALYFNVFVGVVQAFLKIPPLNALAPTQSEPPFLVAQLVVLAIFVALGVLAVRSFHPEADAPALSPPEPHDAPRATRPALLEARDMIILQIEHPVPNFDAWKQAFDSDPIGRERSGVRRYRVLRPVDDPNYAIVDLEFATIGEAEACLAALRALWSRVEGAIMEGPRTRIVETVESRVC